MNPKGISRETLAQIKQLSKKYIYLNAEYIFKEAMFR